VRGWEGGDIVRFKGVGGGISVQGGGGGSGEGAPYNLFYLAGVEVDAGPESCHC
jgi:hypothetical protein